MYITKRFSFPDLCHAVEQNNRNTILILHAILTIIKPCFIYQSPTSEFIGNFDIGNISLVTIWRKWARPEKKIPKEDQRVEADCAD